MGSSYIIGHSQQQKTTMQQSLRLAQEPAVLPCLEPSGTTLFRAHSRVPGLVVGGGVVELVNGREEPVCGRLRGREPDVSGP